MLCMLENHINSVMYVRPPPIHTGSEGTAAAAAPGDSPVDSAEGTDKVSPTINNTVASIDCGSPGDKTFVENIHALLEVPSYSSIISWNDAGTAVIVHDVAAFISTIMPVHFKHSQFGSFTRRMRRWGFRVTKKLSSPLTPPVPTERGKSNVLEFSSEFFLRDQPGLCVMMKDERQAKKKFQFLDRNVRRKTDGVENNQAASLPGVGDYFPPSSSKTMSGSMKTPSEGNQPVPVHFPSSFPNMNMNTASNQTQSQQSNTGTGTGGLNMAMNDGYLHTYSQDISSTPMISPSSIHSSMPMMNMMMPPNVPQLQYNPYGYNVPPPGSGFGQASPGPGFQYSRQYTYPPPFPQEHPLEQQLLQQHQQQMQSQQQQQQQQPNQQYPSLPPTAASFFQNADARASVILTSSLSQSSSDELPTYESGQLDLLPTKKSPNRPFRSQFDAEQDARESRERR